MTDYAVVHGNFSTRGGAERVAEHLARSLDAPLYIGFADRTTLTQDDIDYRPLFDGSLSKLCNRGKLRDAYHWWSWQHRPELTEYDALVISGNEASWYVPAEGQRIVRYIHHPPHTAYDYYHDRADSRLTRLYTFAIRAAINHTLPFVDDWIANSEVVSNRMEQYWNVESDVIYPPVDIDEYEPSPHDERVDYYLILSRLESRKRIDSVFPYFEDNPESTLRIAGEGSQREELESCAPENVIFEGYVSEPRKEELLRNTTALIMPTFKEDFGIVPIEAMACGTPVIGVKEGFTEHQIQHGKTGYLYERGRLNSAIGEFETDGVSDSAQSISDSVSKFRPSRFHKEIQEFV